jgi:DNA-binding transcriptional regulator LsrR (DeoR family)
MSRKKKSGRGTRPQAEALRAGSEQAPGDEAKRDRFAYTVAALAWREGLAANAIVRALGLESKPVHLMKVKRALLRAHDKQFLTLRPPMDQALEQELFQRIKERCGNDKLRLYVVNDLLPPATGLVIAQAAEVAFDIIKEVARARAGAAGDGRAARPDVVISNAGGRTVAEVVKVLRRNPPLLDESDEEDARLRQHLLFVAANAAYLPTHFHRSANFLAVTMAETFRARHFALPREDADELVQEHKQLVSNADLFICGAGSRQSGLMTQYFLKARHDIPPEAVGDLAFNLLDREGNPVGMVSPAGQELLKRLNPTLDLQTLRNIAERRRVLLVLDSEAPSPGEDGSEAERPRKQPAERSRAGERHKLLDKSDIAAAVLKHHYATDVVLGARLARAILKVY